MAEQLTYICRDTDTLEEKEIKLTFEFVFGLGCIRLFTHSDGREYRVLHEKGKEIKPPTPRKGINRHPEYTFSDASGVHPNRVPEARKLAQKLHPGIDFEPDGRAKFSGKQARAAWFRHCQLKNKDGGYYQ